MSPFALLFPGQGLQYVGMGQSLALQFPVAKEVFAQTDDALGFALSKLAWEGPETELTRTEHAQPAILAHSIAALRVLQTQMDLQPTVAIGHSLGEWTALVAAGVLDLQVAVQLVHVRGQFMQNAVPPGTGAMAAVLGLDRAKVQELCDSVTLAHDLVVVAAHNDPLHTVISGHAPAVQRASEACMQAGALKVLPLPVSAPFHSPLMQAAAERLAAALEKLVCHPPQVPILSTVHGELVRDPTQFQPLLVQQMTLPVLWSEAIAQLSSLEIAQAYALGPAQALPGMVKRNARGVKVTVLAEAGDFGP